jgi:hypothetical protein
VTPVIRDMEDNERRQVTFAQTRSLCDLLGVDSEEERRLVLSIHASIDSCVRKHHDMRSLIEDLSDGRLDSVRQIFRNQVKIDVVRKPGGIVMCDECEKRSSVVKCDKCLDNFCQECFDVLHATGNRRMHTTTEIEQLVCVSCDVTVADVQCIQCGTFYCSPCFSSMHAIRPELLKHRKRVVSGLVCQECEHSHASVLCENCIDLFCTPCFLRIHKSGNRRTHSHSTIDIHGHVYRNGLLVDFKEAQELLDRARESIADATARNLGRFDCKEYQSE